MFIYNCKSFVINVWILIKGWSPVA